jgi:DNA-binding transcriptional MerR regulator
VGVVNNSSTAGFLRSGELAKLAGVSTDTLRHYERMGVLPQARRSANGYREYSCDTVDHLSVVRNALAVGFTLDELASVFKMRRRGGAPCREVRDLAVNKLAHVEALLRDLAEVRNRLRATLKDWDARLEKAGTGEPARLLEALASRASRQRQSNPVSGRFGPGNGHKRKP